MGVGRRAAEAERPARAARVAMHTGGRESSVGQCAVCDVGLRLVWVFLGRYSPLILSEDTGGYHTLTLHVSG